MKKILVITLAAAALSGSVLALSAAAAPGDPPSPGDARATSEAGGFMLDAHLAGMKAALNLTPDQEKNWAAFESAVRDAAQARREAMREMRKSWSGDERPSPIDRMTATADRLAKASTEIKAIADAAKPLYESLDGGQRHHFGPLMASLIERGRDRGPMTSHVGMGPEDGAGPRWNHGDHRPGQSTED
jgi:Spy/CpxP family protein refolding chaperone